MTYTCRIAAFTVDIGPFSDIVMIMQNSNYLGMLFIAVEYHKTVYMNKYLQEHIILFAEAAEERNSFFHLTLVLVMISGLL